MSVHPDAFELLNSPLDGRTLIEASAGTGKTYTLVAIYLRLLVQFELRVDQILVVTFTEAATQELRDRLRRCLRDACEVFAGGATQDDYLLELYLARTDKARDLERLRQALSCFDEAAVFTIHGFCRRMLQENAFESGSLFDTELLSDQDDLQREIVEDFWRSTFIEAEPCWLRWSQKKGAGVTDLLAFVRPHGKAADLRVIPQVAEVPADQPWLHQVESCFAQARAGWLVHRDAICSLLQNSTALNRNMYRIESIPLWCHGLSVFFEQDDPLSLPEYFGRFTSSGLTAALKKGQSLPAHPLFDQCERLKGAIDALEQVWQQRLMNLKWDLLNTYKAELARRKQRQNVRAFDDLLLDLRTALQRDAEGDLVGELRRRYPAALIDEFQDTDPVQYAIFSTIYPHPGDLLFLIGDPKQAIYSFRGADLFAYLRAAGEIERRYTLNTNFRSDGPLVSAVNHLFSRVGTPFVFADIPFAEVHPAPERQGSELRIDGQGPSAPLRLWFMRRDGDKPISAEKAVPFLAEATASEIVRMLQAADERRFCLEGRPVNPGDMAVLVRTNQQARQVQKALRARRVPSVLYSSESLFDARELDELRLVLAAVLDPADDAALRTALATQMLGFDGAALERAATDESGWEGLCERFAGYHDLWERRGFMAMAAHLLHQENVRERLLAYDDGERRLTNLLHGIEVLHQAAQEQRLGMDALGVWLAERLLEKPQQDEYQMRLETDETAVKLVTIHRSKGLEYPIVFCPFSWNGSRQRGAEISFHDPRAERALTLDLGSLQREEHIPWAEEEILAENLRLLYVALTRARNLCILTWGAFNQSETSAPAYLFHPPPVAASGAWTDRLASHVKTLDDDAMHHHLAQMAHSSEGRVLVESVPQPDYRRYSPREDTTQTLHVRHFKGRLAAERRIASFSSLAAGRSEALDLPDHDFSQESQADTPSSLRDDRADILDFPRGARAGSCLHAIFEELDFAAPDTETARLLVAAKLQFFGFEDSWTPAVLAMVQRVMQASLPGLFGRVQLGTVAAAERLTEMEFHFPAAQLSAQALCDLMRQQIPPVFSAVTQDPLSGLDFQTMQGFVKGYVDLVFKHNGRYYILDWKSNDLGAQRSDYRPEKLAAVMVRDAYVLQYQLYCLALHRWLRARLPGYAYERHFGGVFYLFVRGIEADGDQSNGIFYDCPAAQLIADMDSLIGGAS